MDRSEKEEEEKRRKSSMFRQLHKDLCFQCKSHLNKCRSMFPSTRKEYQKEGWKRMVDGWRKQGGTERKRERRKRRMECKCVFKSYHTLMGPSREWKQGEFNCRKKETQSVPRLAFRRARNVDFLQKGISLAIAKTSLIRPYIFKNVPHRRESINHLACTEKNFETEGSAIKRRQFVEKRRGFR